MTPKEENRLPFPFLVGGAIVALVVAGLVLFTHNAKQPGPVAELRLPMGTAERAYAAQIKFLEPKMSRAANFLNQEVTFISGAVSNQGSRNLREIEVTVEFRDQFNQVVLRDTRRVLGSRSVPLAPGTTREFQFGFEHVPADWNAQYPSLRVTGLLLE